MRLVLILSCLVAGCALRPPGPVQPAESEIAVVIDPGPEILRPLARGDARAGGGSRAVSAPRRAEDFDRSSAAERRAAVAAAQAAGGGRDLGQTLATLGPPAEPGFWLRTGLVTAVAQGQVQAPGGTAVAVELRPSGGAAGAGSQISLAALRALGLPLTAIAPLRVTRLD
jgi:hypothetical protein